MGKYLITIPVESFKNSVLTTFCAVQKQTIQNEPSSETPLTPCAERLLIDASKRQEAKKQKEEERERAQRMKEDDELAELYAS